MQGPPSVSGIRKFLQMVNQLKKFIPNYVKRRNFCKTCFPKKNHLYWAKAFNTLTEDAVNTPVLDLYNPIKETKVSADSSSFGLGVLLLQIWSHVICCLGLQVIDSDKKKRSLSANMVIWNVSSFYYWSTFPKNDQKRMMTLLGLQALDILPPKDTTVSDEIFWHHIPCLKKKKNSLHPIYSKRKVSTCRHGTHGDY